MLRACACTAATTCALRLATHRMGVGGGRVNGIGTPVSAMAMWSAFLYVTSFMGGSFAAPSLRRLKDAPLTERQKMPAYFKKKPSSSGPRGSILLGFGGSARLHFLLGLRH